LSSVERSHSTDDDLDFIGPLVKESYSNAHYAGRDPIDPRTLFLICLLEFIEGLSDLQVVKKLRRAPLGEEKFKRAFPPPGQGPGATLWKLTSSDWKNLKRSPNRSLALKNATPSRPAARSGLSSSRIKLMTTE